MDHIQTDVSDEALVTAIRANMCEFFRHLSRSNPAEHVENQQFTRWFTPLAHPWFNGVLSSASPDDNDSFIDETIEYFRLKGTNIFTWWMEPHVNSSAWKSVLSRHGFGFSNDTPGMAVDLDKMNDTIPSIDGFEIRSVDDGESLHTWEKYS